MIEYYEQLLQEEQEAITEIIQTLFRQTFILEQKFDRRAGRLQYEKDYRALPRSRHDSGSSGRLRQENRRQHRSQRKDSGPQSRNRIHYP